MHYAKLCGMLDYATFIGSAATKHADCILPAKANEAVEQWAYLTTIPRLQDDTKNCNLICHSYQRAAELIMKSTLEVREIDFEEKHDLRYLYRRLKPINKELGLPTFLPEEDWDALGKITDSAKDTVYITKISCKELKEKVLMVDKILDSYVKHLENNS